MSEETYNGWTNYETWGCALILSNDQGLDEMIRERVEELREEDDDFRGTLGALIDYIGELTETLCGIGAESEDFGIPEPSMMASQLLNLGRVDFREIAEGYLED